MIRLLEKNIADKIAAGEVVDRPLSVVKELVENAIDAGSKSIVIEIRKGGKEYIRITDDGCGIPHEEVALAFKRHATSKIATVKDLDSIGTLGFRGEALASIAAVAKVRMVTKTDSESAGTQCDIEGSETADISVTGADSGTTVIVRDLFFNTPARLKFMKSDAAESNLINEFISQIALCYPEIRFRFINNGNTLFTTPGRGDRLSAIYTIYGKTIGSCLVKAEDTNGDMHLEAYVSNTGESRNSRKNQVFFVNGRVIKGKVMDNAVKMAYSERLFPGRFPIVFLFLDVDPSTLDVNIHPNKREVRFDDDRIVEDFIVETIKKALRTEQAVPQAKADKLVKIEPRKPAVLPEKKVTVRPANVKPVEPPKPVPVKVVNPKPEEKQIDVTEILSTLRTESVIKENPAPIVQEVIKKAFDFTELDIVGTVFSTYIIGQKGDAFYLIDQHAAHERIFYEKLMKEFDDSEKHRQPVMVPITFDISVTVAATDWLDILDKMGFTIDEFGPRTYRITEIPMFMGLSEAEDFVNDFIGSITTDTNLRSRRILDTIATKACKAAVKGGDNLHENEITALLKNLNNCDNPYSCPHGRPTYVKFSKSQIERMFRRA